MKGRTLLLMALLAGTAPLGMAGSCGVGTLATYIGTTCSIDGVTFSKFGYTGTGSGGAHAIPASGISVTPSGVGFEFTAPWNVGPNEELDSAISYTASGNLSDLILSMGGFFFTGGGSASVAETTNVPGVDVAVFSNAFGTRSFDSISFAPVSSISVIKDIAVNGHNGSTAVSVVFNQFNGSGTPEPASMFLMGTGLVGLALFMRRRMRAAESIAAVR